MVDFIARFHTHVKIEYTSKVIKISNSLKKLYDFHSAKVVKLKLIKK